MHRIVGLGNPLLDISAVVPSEFLARYGLRLNNAILAGKQHEGLCEEMMRRYQCSYLAGGATQNSIRAAQWVSGVKGTTGYMGCVGTDNYASLLATALASDGVSAYYESTSTYPTGTCACLIHSSERSLVANLGAALHFSLSHLQKHYAVIANAEIIYSSGFFFTSSAESAIECAQLAGKTGKIYGINLAAEYIVEHCKSTIEAVLPFTELVFCNESEIRRLGVVWGLGEETLETLAERLADGERKTQRPRRVIVTCGSAPTVVATSGQGIALYPVPRIAPHLIIDTNGAGDSFVGGFLSQYLLGRPIPQCVATGHSVAQVVLQREGCSFPPRPK